MKHNKRRVRQERFTLAHGDMVVQWPENITYDDLDDLRVWFELFTRKIHRAVMSDPTNPSTIEGE